MGKNNFEKYIPLKSAAQFYGYTRDHLGLMIRQNKLKGIKLGSYYVTTNEWMADYIKNFADLNHPTSRGKLSNKFLTEILSSKKGGEPGELIVDDKNTAGKMVKTIVLKNTGNNAVKKYNVSDNLKREILKELTRCQSLADNKVSQADINAPYVILPIRKMEDEERENILSRL